MKFEIKKVRDLERKVSIDIPADNIDKKINSKLEGLSKRVKISGFRTGKIPLNVIQKRYGQEVRQEVISDVIKDSLQQVFWESKVDPVTMPTIDHIDDKNDQGLSFTALFEVRPEIKFSDMSKIKFTKNEVSITEQDIENAVERLRGQHTIWLETNEKASDGMKVEVDFVGTIDDIKFAGGTGENVPFIVGSKSMLEEFEQGVIGLDVGKSNTVEVNFPKDYHSKDLSGKKASFLITLKKSSKPELPEINEEFVKKFDRRDGDIKKFYEKIRKNLETEALQRQLFLFQEEVFKKFSDANDILLPEGMIKQEIKRLRSIAMEQMKRYKPEIKESDFPDEHFLDKAKEQVKLILLITEYIIVNDIKVDESNVSSKIDLIASTYDDPEAVAKWFYSDKAQLDKIKSQVLEEQAVNEIASQSEVQIEKLSYTEFMSK